MAHNHKTYVLHHYSAGRVLQDNSGLSKGPPPFPPKCFLAKQLTLSQPGRFCPLQYYEPPRMFRSRDGPETVKFTARGKLVGPYDLKSM